MPIDQPDLDNFLMRLFPQVILDCVKLIVKTNAHGIHHFLSIFQRGLWYFLNPYHSQDLPPAE